MINALNGEVLNSDGVSFMDDAELEGAVSGWREVNTGFDLQPYEISVQSFFKAVHLAQALIGWAVISVKSGRAIGSWFGRKIYTPGLSNERVNRIKAVVDAVLGVVNLGSVLGFILMMESSGMLKSYDEIHQTEGLAEIAKGSLCLILWEVALLSCYAKMDIIYREALQAN